MLKRILSGVLAAVLLITAIPFTTASAADEDTIKKRKEAAEKWTAALFEKCVDAEKSADIIGEPTGGIDDNGNITYGMGLISVKSCNKNLRVTLCPILYNSGNKLSYSFSSRDSRDPYRDSIKLWSQSGTQRVAVGSAVSGGLFAANDTNDESLKYGTIGAILSNDLKGDAADKDAADIMINPLFLWNDLIVGSTEYAEQYEVNNAKSADTTYIYAHSPVNSTDTSNVISRYWVDPLSVYAFIAKIHMLYHTKSVWSSLSGIDESLFDKYKISDTTSCDGNCGILSVLTAVTTKGTISCTHGVHEQLKSAQVMYTNDKLDTRKSVADWSTSRADLDVALNFTLYRLYNIAAGNYEYTSTGTPVLSSLLGVGSSSLAQDVIDTFTDSDAISEMSGLSAWANGVSDKSSASSKIKGSVFMYAYLDNFLSANNMGFGKNGDGFTYSKYSENIVTEMMRLLNHPGSNEINGALLISNNAQAEDSNTSIGQYVITTFSSFLTMINDIRLASKKAAAEASKVIVNNRLDSEFKIGGSLVTARIRALLPAALGHSQGVATEFNDFEAIMKLEYPKGATYENVGWLTNAASLQKKGNILSGLAMALQHYDNYEDFKSSFMPVQTWKDLHNSAADVWADASKEYNLFIRAYPVDSNKYETSRNLFVNEVIGNAISVALDTTEETVLEEQRMLLLHTVWNCIYATDKDGTSKLYFKSGEEPAWAQNTLHWTNTVESSVTMTAAAAIDQYKAQYEILNKTTTTSMPGAETLKLRSEIIDFYAKYNLPKDDFLEEIIGKCTDIYKEIQDDTLFMESLGNGYLCYEPMNYDKAGELYVYQQELVYEATYYGDMVYISLILDVLSDGVTLEGNGKYINVLSDLKVIHDKYRGVASDNMWYGSGRSDTAVEEKGASFRDESQKSQLDTLAGLYDYLVALGMISSGDYTLDIYDEQDPITLFWTQTNGNITFSKDYYTGRALSATYIPMQTNVYDPYSMLDYVDTDWIEDFHYKYGFYRKALLIDTNVDAAVDSYVSNTQGTTRIATLGDLFNCESDIVLYIDEHFYGLTELAELQNKTYDRLASTNPGLWDKIKNSISDMFSMFREVDFDVALKQKVSVYSDKIQENVSGMDFKLETDDEGNVITELKPYDQYILTPDAIKQYIASDEYTPMLGYAVVSNIYRNRDAFVTVHNVGVTRTPVFESSPTLATIANSSDDAKDTLYNYALLKNIAAMTTVGYETSTDMSSPIYCDIYGNIVTESGLVVIPAACNATLHRGDSQWQPISTGFLSTYGEEWSIPTSWNLDENFMIGMFYKNEDLGVWEIRNKTIQGMEINFAQLSYADKNVNVALKEWYNYDLVNGSEINQYNSLNILHEVLRGAPLENIDFDAENLNSARKVDKSGLIAAAKLDNIVNSLDWDDENSIMSVPRLSFIDNYQYVVVFIFKILLVIIVTALMVTIYVDVLKTKISWRTIGRCVLTLVLGVASVLLIPVSYDISYYQSNKLLLQDEAEYIMMLNTEKNMSGREIGVYEVTEPEQHTQIMIKLEDFEFNWLSELPNVITSDSINVMNDKYQEFLNNSLLANKDNVQAMNDGMYMDVQDIFDTSVLNFSTTSKQLYQKVSVDPVASYYVPYYYFLDALLTNMNDFNSTNNVYAYSTKIMRGGAVKTVNLCDAYFNSKDFMESTDSDFLGLYQLYDTMGSMIILPIFNEDSITGARQSQWFVGSLMAEDDVLDRLELMTTKVREFVMKNKSLIGKVTDETFLKCMAMDLAIEYNNIFGIPSANAFEVYNLSNADLMRLTIADKASTLEGSPMSFSRFVYNEAGTPGVYASVFLVITTMFVQTMKTIITIAIMVLLIISVFVFKILLRKSNQSIAGYLLTLLVICSTNILYAIILKISLAIPQTGLAPTLCIIIQIIVQLAYLFILAAVLGFALRDWKNIGFTHYEAIGQKIKEKFSRHRSRTPRDRYDSQPRGVDGWDYYRQLVKENERRMKKVGTH